MQKALIEIMIDLVTGIFASKIIAVKSFVLRVIDIDNNDIYIKWNLIR